MSELARDERGFTLIETIAALAILGIISVGLAGLVGTGARVAGGAGDRVAGSASARMLAVHLLPDVHGADDAVASASGEGIACAGVESPRLRLRSAGRPDVVYGVRRTAGDWVMERHRCVDGASVEAIVVARQLTGPTGVVPARLPVTGPFTGASITVVTDESEGADRRVTVSGTRRTA